VRTGSFISEQSVSAAFGQASFTLEQTAAGALRVRGARSPLPERLQLIVVPLLQLLPLLLNRLLLRRARRARRTRRAWTRGTLPRKPGTVGRDGLLRILSSYAFPRAPVMQRLAEHHNLAHSLLRTNSRGQTSTHSQARGRKLTHRKKW
jgi:hypothetical protein